MATLVAKQPGNLSNGPPADPSFSPPSPSKGQQVDAQAAVSDSHGSGLHVVAGTSVAAPGDASAPDCKWVEVEESKIGELLKYYAQRKWVYGSFQPELLEAQEECNELFALDYEVGLIDNSRGQLCGSYPPQIIIMEKQRGSKFVEKVNDTAAIESVLLKSKFARVHGRFPVPALVVRGKNLCRSSTIPVWGETVLWSARNLFNSFVFGSSAPDTTSVPDDSAPTSASSTPATAARQVPSSAPTSPTAPSDAPTPPPSTPGRDTSLSSLSAAALLPDLSLVAQREADIAVLECLKMFYICDLMVETKKKKMGLTLTSSEKAEKERYGSFALTAMPYPGCEFFKEYRDNGFSGHKLCFDWSQAYVNAQLSIWLPKELQLHSPFTFSWADHEKWDLVELTQRYMLLLLQYLADPRSDHGVLVHCISGWDRTPMFVSLLRLSLWADGEIHGSLSPSAMLYLTLAYDWMLFTHQLNNRLRKGEELFYFAFAFLSRMTDGSFSLHSRIQRAAEAKIAAHDSSKSHRKRSAGKGTERKASHHSGHPKTKKRVSALTQALEDEQRSVPVDTDTKQDVDAPTIEEPPRIHSDSDDDDEEEERGTALAASSSSLPTSSSSRPIPMAGTRMGFGQSTRRSYGGSYGGMGGGSFGSFASVGHCSCSGSPHGHTCPHNVGGASFSASSADSQFHAGSWQLLAVPRTELPISSPSCSAQSSAELSVVDNAQAVAHTAEEDTSVVSLSEHSASEQFVQSINSVAEEEEEEDTADASTAGGVLPALRTSSAPCPLHDIVALRASDVRLKRSRSDSFSVAAVTPSIEVPPAGFVYGGSAPSATSPLVECKSDRVATPASGLAATRATSNSTSSAPPSCTCSAAVRLERERQASASQTAGAQGGAHSTPVDDDTLLRDQRLPWELSSELRQRRRQLRLEAVQRLFMQQYHVNIADHSQGQVGAPPPIVGDDDAAAAPVVQPAPAADAESSLARVLFGWLSQ